MINFVTEVRIAARNLKRNRNRTLIGVLTIACGLIAYLLAGGFIEWIFESMRESTIRSQLGHVQIVRPGYMEKGIADPYNFLLPAKSIEFEKIKDFPEVVSVAQRLAFSGLISHGETTISFIGEGIEPDKEEVISSHIHIRSGSNVSIADQREVLLGSGLAKKLGVNPGDTVVLLVTAANGTPNAIEAKVSGAFVTAVKEFDDNALRLPIEISRKLMRVQGSTSWVLLLNDTTQTLQTVTRLRSTLPITNFEAIPWSDLADFYNKTVVLFGKQINLMRAIIAIIIVLTISNTQTMSVLERTTEIGTILATGLHRSGILRMFILEGALIGSIGGVFGIFLGFGIAEILSLIGIPMPPAPGMDTGFTAQILVTPRLAVHALVLAIATTLIASAVPAWKASRMNIVNALRCNQ
ncbi:ABC transporter permease [Ferribacterium limneticum]|uniref:ABC transporter permease n=1 Tax=Ferribacterium limneticum TaxID=76259 RepID=UPI001CF91031|nr:FtsX-like permease family protein [Ferribacterium limneticum]UCV24751.1 ABC transporter permease [Ferribacterium limneticum]